MVLTITKHLRQVGVVGKFVEFFGPGVSKLSIADRATIANMCPEYGATVGFFPVDERSLDYLKQTSRNIANLVFSIMFSINIALRDMTLIFGNYTLLIRSILIYIIEKRLLLSLW